MIATLVLAPLVCGLVGLLLPMRNRPLGAALGIAGAAVSLVLTVLLLADGTRGEFSTTWARFGDLGVTLTALVDTRALLMSLAVAVVALCVQVYSVGYLAGDGRYGPYAAQISIFTGAMLTVVFSGDLISLLIGWEVMGACSYLLIAHDRTLPEAPAAAVKAFLVTRVGDIGFLLGIVLLGVTAGSFRITEVLAAVPSMSGTTVTAAALLLLAGVAGKSAQFPLHTWLPDAMAGPTPISALIHAATMVAAGVYVVARLFPVFAASPTALAVMAAMAGVTLLLGALAATAADDIKRVLAWSTVSQLGYMMAALSAKAVDAAMFHLLAHAAFKALLFLCAGSVIHAVGGNLMSRMGGLRKDMPLTFWTMTIGLGALIGLPPFVGFFSKEAVVGALHAQPALWLAALLGVALTAWYSTRLWLLTFFGRPRDASVHAHEPGWAMRAPLLLLAVPAAGLGVGALVADYELAHLGVELVLPLALAVLGVAAAWWGWRRADGGDPAAVLGTAGPFLAGGLGLDTVQDRLVVRPVRALSRAVTLVDVSGVDGAVNGLGRATTGAGAGLAAWHRATLPRALAGILVGAVLVTVTAVVFA
ncbi:NADH-quinone oxidoreductase subunit 5 family protein [Catellatospora paridis]|uniref:NADH-quinone oxidoreductase subunit 5 family protein n=1 Tax=Catellatospora paridis TaxID=1617086 RepID=UPI0012D467C9|nr:NADH-quinone oxidoreductase subunit L [Catellatospora paridis]